jgi:flagellar protein FlaG
MEVRAVGQGGQNTLDINRSNNEKPIQVPNNYSTEKYKVNDNSIRDRDLNENEVKDAIEKLNKFLEDNGTHAEYEVHDKFNTIMIKIIDNKTKEVIQEVPPKKILDMVAKMMEMVGVLFDKKA